MDSLLNTNKYITHCVDTDAFTMCKQDMSPWTQEEIDCIKKLLKEEFPKNISWDQEPLIKTMVTIKSKNYILLLENGKLVIKGSGLKKTTAEPAIREYFKKFIDCLVYDRQHELVDLYHSYVKEAMCLTDMKRWVVRKTITSKVLEGTRANETKVVDAIKGTDLREGDRCYLFYKPDESLCLLQNFNGVYDKMRLVEKIYDATKTFSTVVDMKQFKNYALKRNEDALIDLVEGDD